MYMYLFPNTEMFSPYTRVYPPLLKIIFDPYLLEKLSHCKIIMKKKFSTVVVGFFLNFKSFIWLVLVFLVGMK